MKPIKSYRIWFTQRSGSTLLCKALESTGIAGIPGEYFNLMDAKSLCELHQVKDYEQLKHRLWQLGTTANGVFGIKHSMHSSIYHRWFQEILTLRQMDTPNPHHQEVWSDLFPNCKHLYLTRRNKVRQAVSWWKAIQDQVWHLENGHEHRNGEDFYQDKYDFDALHHLFKEAALKECAMEQYFEQYQIIPFTIVYEDFVRDYENTVRRIVDYLEIDAADYQVGQMFYSKTANSRSEQWVESFKNDLQKNMSGEKVW